MTQVDRLKLLMKELGLNGKRLAEALSLTGAAVSDWISGKAPLRKANCLAIQALYGVSWAWLLDGEGPMWVSTPNGVDAGDMVFVPHLNDPSFFTQSGSIQPPGKPGPKTPFPQTFLQGLLDEIGAGTLSDFYLVECVEEAMRPTIHLGDQILINTALSLRECPRRDGLFLVRNDTLGGAMRIRRVRYLEDCRFIRLTVDSMSFYPLDLDVNDTPTRCYVLGQVCWIGRSIQTSERLNRNW